MKKILFFLFISTVVASNAAIRWIEKDYDFGLFKEIAGPKTGISRFINIGPDTIAVLDVKPSCGCTSADFTRTPLLPGDTATISYTYDPDMRPGRFEKTVRVTLSNGVKQIIRIKGNVLGTPESLSTLYPVNAGMMRLSDSIIPFGEVIHGRSPIAFVNAYVVAPDTIMPRISSPVEALIVSPSVEKAGPGDVVTFTLSLDSRALLDYGPMEFPLLIEENNDDIIRDDSYNLVANAVIVPDPTDFKLLQNGRSPEVVLDKSVIDLGQTEGNIISSKFTIRNSGKSPLEILAVYPTSSAIKIIDLPKSIKNGKSADVAFEIDTSKLAKGPQKLSIEILTNDPNSTHISLPVALIP